MRLDQTVAVILLVLKHNSGKIYVTKEGNKGLTVLYRF